MAAICAAGMMLENVGEVEAGKAIDRAVIEALGSGKVKAVTGEEGDTQKAGDTIAELI